MDWRTEWAGLDGPDDRWTDRKTAGLVWVGGAEAGGYSTALCIAAHQPGWLVSVRGVTPVSHSGPRSHGGCKASH